MDRGTLHKAVRDQNVESVQELLSQGANVNEKENGRTPALHLAVYSGNEQILKLLLEDPNVEIDAKNSEGQPALFYALIDFWFTMAKILVFAGADVSVKSPDYERTTLHLAAQFNDWPLVEFLLAREDVDVNQKDKYGYTALHCLAENRDDEGVIKIAEALLDRGADVSAKDTWGRKPLQLLVRERSKDFVSRAFDLFSKYSKDNPTPASHGTADKRDTSKSDSDDKVFLCLLKEIKDEDNRKLTDSARCQKLGRRSQALAPERQSQRRNITCFLLILILSHALVQLMHYSIIF